MTRAIVALILWGLVLPVVAYGRAPQTNAPPGNSAIDEYLETVPGASGNTRPRPSGHDDGTGGLTAAQRAALGRLGPDGKTLVTAIEATGTPTSRGTHERLVASGDGHSPAGAILDAITGRDGDGMGLALPALLIAAIIAAIIVAAMRRRATSRAAAR